MANELQVTGSFSFAKNGIASFARAVTSLNVSVNGNGGVYEAAFATSTSAAALSLGGLASLGWAWFHNLDAVNTINLLTGNGGVVFASLLPGEIAFLRFGSGVTAPYVQAAAGTPLLEYAILPP